MIQIRTYIEKTEKKCQNKNTKFKDIENVEKLKDEVKKR